MNRGIAVGSLDSPGNKRKSIIIQFNLILKLPHLVSEQFMAIKIVHFAWTFQISKKKSKLRNCRSPSDMLQPYNYPIRWQLKCV